MTWGWTEQFLGPCRHVWVIALRELHEEPFSLGDVLFAAVSLHQHLSEKQRAFGKIRVTVFIHHGEA